MGTRRNQQHDAALGVYNAREAEKTKVDGNLAYKRNNYVEALRFYSKAIELLRTASLCRYCVAPYYGNRAACHMMLGQIKAALKDARHSIRLDKNFVKGHVREAKCHLALGDGTAAEHAIMKAVQLEPNNSSLLTELNKARTFLSLVNDAKSNFAKRDYMTSLNNVNCSLHYATDSTSLKLLKAECLMHLFYYAEAEEIINNIKRSQSNNMDALFVSGLMLYYRNNMDDALACFVQVLKQAPDHKRTQDTRLRVISLQHSKNEGNAAFQKGHYQKAYHIYNIALAIDPDNIFTNATLYVNKAVACVKLNNNTQAIKDCTSAIQLLPNYVKAYLRRAKCYMDELMFEEAVNDYEEVCKLEKTTEFRKLLEDARYELKESRRTDYYRILGIPWNASSDAITKAYRKQALLHHPDRHVNASQVVKKEQERMFKELIEAYSILSDPKKRYCYDSGEFFS